MKEKINSKEKNLFKFIQSNDLDFPFETSQFLGLSEKKNEKEEKNTEKNAKQSHKKIENHKKNKNTENLLIKKVVKLRKKISKKADQIERKNEITFKAPTPVTRIGYFAYPNFSTSAISSFVATTFSPSLREMIRSSKISPFSSIRTLAWAIVCVLSSSADK